MRFILRRTVPLLLLALLASCGDKSCQYHQGVNSITLSANPASVATNDRSLITALGTGQDNLPMADGTVITFVTDIGSFDPGPQAVMTGGIARITFLSGGSNATARIFARAGSTVSPTIELPIGLPAVGSIQIIANPGSVPKEGGKVTLTATVQSKDKLPLPGVGVIFNTDNGTLASNGSPQNTNDNGQARDFLQLRENATSVDLQITISANIGNITDSVTIIQHSK